MEADSGTDSRLYGLSPNSPTVVNELGGKQSDLPYRADLLPASTILGIAKVLDEGARKYGENNWKNISVEEHVNHALVHLYAWLMGDTQDEHLLHVCCRALFAEWTSRNQPQKVRSDGNG